MSKQEFSRLDVLLRVRSGGLRITDACVLIGLQRRQFSSPSLSMTGTFCQLAAVVKEQ